MDEGRNRLVHDLTHSRLPNKTDRLAGRFDTAWRSDSVVRPSAFLAALASLISSGWLCEKRTDGTVVTAGCSGMGDSE